jgi:hypothetical protein
MSSYLVDPETFPARAEGAPWGDVRVGLRIGGEAIRLEGVSRAQSDTIEELWSGFVVAPSGDGGDEAEVSVFRAEPRAFRSFDRSGWTYSLDFDYGSTHTHFTGIDLIARIDWGTRLRGALWIVSEEPEVFHGALENFLRVFVSHALALRGGLLLHSASVLDPGGARLFLGRSGAGKSTVSRSALASGRSVPSDDLNLVLSDGRLAGSPFLGDVGSRENGSHPLVGIYRLEKGATDAVRRLGPGEAFAALLACSSFINRSPFLRERLWSNLTALAGRVPSYSLTFRREGAFWALLSTC